MARPPMPPLEETFGVALDQWRVVDQGLSAPAAERFAVMSQVLGLNNAEEFKICAVQYRPHAEAFAAVPELVTALQAVEEMLPAVGRELVRGALLKAQGVLK